jgi:arylsulfatase A-like enzyme
MWFLILSLMALPQTSSRTEPSAVREERPNIVLIYADDLGYTDLACYGSELHPTPHLNKLAADGMRFTDAYANAPNCAPSRASLMSGQYTPRHGVYTVGSPARGKEENRGLKPAPNKLFLDDEVHTLPEALQAAGYKTAHFGKWHVGEDPLTQGFDVNIGGNQAGHPKSYFSPYRNKDLDDGDEGEYLTDRLSQEAVAFVEENRERPFFLYLSHYSVHTPIQAKADRKKYYKERNREGNAGYAAMVESLDESVGRLVECLETNGLSENTLIVFTSDNGGHGSVTSMAPLRGAKGMLYEGGIREPMIAKWPGRIAAGSVETTPVIGTDLYPTFVRLAGAELSEGTLLDGVDLTNTLLGKGDLADRALYWHFPAYLEAGGKLKKTTPWRTTPVGAVRSGQFKLMEFFEDGRLELYDLAADLGESNNLAEMHPKKTAELHELMKSWRRETSAAMPTPKDS